MNYRHRILLVEDDRKWGHDLKERLEVDHVCDVDVAFDYARGFELGCQQKYHAAIVDLHLGPADDQLMGLELIRDLQDEGCTFPFIVLSGRTDYRTRVESYRMGAINFISKPRGEEQFYEEFSAALSAAIYTVVVENDGGGDDADDATIVQRGPIRADTVSRAVHVSDTLVEKLAPKEFNVLVFLMKRGRATMDELIAHIYGTQIDVVDHSRLRGNIQNFITRVRRKLEKEVGSEPIVYENMTYRLSWPGH